MERNDTIIDDIRARLAPHGIFLRGILHFDCDGPEMPGGSRARTVMLLGNIGGSIWPSFEVWRKLHPEANNPLDTWSVEAIRPIGEEIGATTWFPSERPWKPFQQWAMSAEGLRASPLGILIHPEFGLWHGYRGAFGFAELIGTPSKPVGEHPCDHCPDRPCLTTCPVGAVGAEHFDVPACRSYIHSPPGGGSCMTSGCIARNACPVGSSYRYCPEQLAFHMAALGRM